MRHVALVGYHICRGVCAAGSGGARYLGQQQEKRALTRERSSEVRTCHVATRVTTPAAVGKLCYTMLLRLPECRHGSASPLQPLRRQACALARTRAATTPLLTRCAQPRAAGRVQRRAGSLSRQQGAGRTRSTRVLNRCCSSAPQRRWTLRWPSSRASSASGTCTAAWAAANQRCRRGRRQLQRRWVATRSEFPSALAQKRSVR